MTPLQKVVCPCKADEESYPDSRWKFTKEDSEGLRNCQGSPDLPASSHVKTPVEEENAMACKMARKSHRKGHRVLVEDGK